MDRLANIYELLEDENDDQRQKKAAPGPQRPKQAPGAPPAKQNQPAQKNQPAAAQKGGKPKGGEQNTLDRRMGVAQNAEAPKGNRPPRQQRERKDREDRPPREGQRQFERRSGTGRPRTENKRGGSGKGNWGTVEDDKQAQTEQVEGQAPAEQQPAENKEAEAKVEVEVQPPEEEDKTKTLDEYFKALKQPVVALPTSKRVDNAKAFEGFVPLKRDLEDEQVAKKDKKKEEGEKEDSGKKTVSADQLLNFKAPEQQGFRGKGRGRGEGSPKGGRGGKGGKRGGAGPKGPAPKFDESSFPTLAATKA